MRIIAGQAKGRKLTSPKGTTTRPMQDRVKEAIFSSLGSVVVGAAVLDLYAGTGSMGLEALSRGADRAVFVERHRSTLYALEKNCELVGLGGEVFAGDVLGFLSRRTDEFDLVFVDPPYSDADAGVERVMVAVAERVRPGGIVVLHRSTGSLIPVAEKLTLVDDRRYGGAQLWRFQKEST